jgi:late competence protein required for DNA uptake (superfamily II DNA/RNA helicase)
MERSMPVAAPVLVNISARTMLCPRCEREQPLRDFVMLGMSPLYASQLVPVYRCGACSHLFALRPGLLGEA